MTGKVRGDVKAEGWDQNGCGTRAVRVEAPWSAYLTGNGLLCVNADSRWHVAIPDARGLVVCGPDLLGASALAEPGGRLLYQWWYRDPQDPCGGGFNVSNAWRTHWR